MARPRKVSAMLGRARDERRRLGDWMTTHHEELLDQLGPGRIDWRPVMNVIGSLDLRDEHGQPVTRDTAARTWARVRRRVADRQVREAAARARPPLRPGEVAPGVRSLDLGSTPGTRPFIELDIAPARPREAAPSYRRSFSTPDDDDAAERIRAVVDAFGAARVPMPKPTT